MSEDLFESLFSKYGKHAYVHKITDTKEVTGLNKRPTKTKEQPCDYICCVHGDMFMAEVKSSENETSFPFGNIRKGQLAAAQRVDTAGGKYWFYIFRTKTREWFKVPARVILDWPRSSMKWSELAPWRI